MVALGVSAIGDVQGAFIQNMKKLPEYYAALDEGRFPIERGYALDADDRIRRYVITELMCNLHLDVPRGRAPLRHRASPSISRAELAELTAPGFAVGRRTGRRSTPRRST